MDFVDEESIFWVAFIVVVAVLFVYLVDALTNTINSGLSGKIGGG